MMVTSQEYQDHQVFSEIDRYARFYEIFADSVSSFSSVGTRAVLNIDSYVYSSIRGTLESIRDILKVGRINDAYCIAQEIL